MKTINDLLKRFNEEFDYSFCCGGDECGITHDMDERIRIKQFITQSIKDALEACRNGEKVFDPIGKKFEMDTPQEVDGWNANTTQYDENVRKFLED